MIAILLLILTTSVTPCWDINPNRWSLPSIAAGGTVVKKLGIGTIKVNCLGGIVNSAGGTPEWRAALRVDGQEFIDATHLLNASIPYPHQVFNKNGSWELAIINLNYVRSLYMNISVDVVFSPVDIPTPVPTVGPEYVDSTSRIALFYAAAAYVPPHDLLSWDLSETCLSGTTSNFTVVDVFDGSNHSIYTPFAFVGIDHERQWIVVSFKGTNGTSDTIADLIQIFNGALYYQHDCVINEYITGKTHSGFCANYQELVGLSIKEKTIKVMQQYSDYPVLITGHSLGGALCSLFTLDLTTTLQATNPKWLKRLVSYTYGQPRVGDGRLSPDLPLLFRVTHSSDIIVHLVSCCSNGNSCLDAVTCPLHGSREVWYPNTNMTLNSYKICDLSGEDPNCSNSRVPSLSINDHLYYFNVQVGAVCYPNIYDEEDD